MNKTNFLLGKSRWIFFAFAFLMAFSACQESDVFDNGPEPLITTANDHGKTISGQYIVVFKPEVLHQSGLRLDGDYDQMQEMLKDYSRSMLNDKDIDPASISHVYSNMLQGFAATLSNEQLESVRNDERVKYIEQDRIIIMRPPWEGGGGGGGGGSTQETPWGITRVGGAVNYTGSNRAWVIDTGIDLTHPDLNVDTGRSRTFITSGKDSKDANDGNGHGTHVAGTIAAINNTIGVVGVAAGAPVVAVKVLDSRGSGSYSGVIAGVDYVGSAGASGDVANMSLGGPVSQALDDAVLAASNKGIRFVIAAGNDGKDANNYSPARVNGTRIYTISAMNSSDVMASWSNWGNPPVDYCAPGVSIKSTWKGGGYNTISGTSMAAPHAAGVILLGSPKTSGYVSGDPDGNPDPIISR